MCRSNVACPLFYGRVGLILFKVILSAADHFKTRLFIHTFRRFVGGSAQTNGYALYFGDALYKSGGKVFLELGIDRRPADLSFSKDFQGR